MENSRQKRERFQAEKTAIAESIRRLNEAIVHQQGLDEAIGRRDVLNLRSDNLTKNLERAELKLKQQPAPGIQKERNDLKREFDATKTELTTVNKNVTKFSKKLTDSGNVSNHAAALVRQINQAMKLVEEENQVRAEEIQKLQESLQKRIDDLLAKDVESIQRIANLETQNNSLRVQLQQSIREHREYEDRMETNMQEAITDASKGLGVMQGMTKRPRTE